MLCAGKHFFFIICYGYFMTKISKRIDSPLVSVIIPAYNRASFVMRAIDSVLCQTYKPVEIVVVDDGSQDGTGNLVTSLCQAHGNIRYVRHDTNRGAQAARNTGILAVRGDFIAFLDSDDEWFPDKLLRQISLFTPGDERLGVVYAGYRETSPDGEHRDHLPKLRGDIYMATLKRWVCDMNTIVVKKAVFDKSGLLNENIRAYQEWDMCIHLARHGTFDYIDDPLAIYHHHDSPTISKDLWLSALGYLDVVEAHQEEILKYCGYYALSRHYLAIGHHFMLANRVAIGRDYFLKAFRHAPYNILALTFFATSFLGYNHYRWLHRTKKRLSGKVL